ncbi:MAG: hypothetical protein ACKVRN_13335 [Pyrinomonadaceae bacterium]
MKTLFVLTSMMVVLFIAAPNKVEAQKRKASKPKPTPEATARTQRAPAELKDWQKSLPLFVKHVESVRTSPTDSKKVSMLVGDSRVLYFAIMASGGGCAGKAPDAVFGPRVQFTGKFEKISPASANERNRHGVQNTLSISFEKTSPGSVLYVFPMTSYTVTWQKLPANSDVRFEAEVNCLVGLEFPNGEMAYSLTLKNAKVLP